MILRTSLLSEVDLRSPAPGGPHDHRGAKRLVHGLIEAARRVIVTLITAFGEFVKGLVSVLLVAFPELAKRARAWIDRCIKQAVDAVNHAAEKQKQLVSKSQVRARP
jgi:hypothetical protein